MKITCDAFSRSFSLARSLFWQQQQLSETIDAIIHRHWNTRTSTTAPDKIPRIRRGRKWPNRPTHTVHIQVVIYQNSHFQPYFRDGPSCGIVMKSKFHFSHVFIFSYTYYTQWHRTRKGLTLLLTFYLAYPPHCRTIMCVHLNERTHFWIDSITYQIWFWK